jgi:hypothetical protein
MASLSSGDRPDKSANGTSKRRHDDNALASAGFGDEQTLADSDQTLAYTEIDPLTGHAPERPA